MNGDYIMSKTGLYKFIAQLTLITAHMGLVTVLAFPLIPVAALLRGWGGAEYVRKWGLSRLARYAERCSPPTPHAPWPSLPAWPADCTNAQLRLNRYTHYCRLIPQPDNWWSNCRPIADSIFYLTITYPDALAGALSRDRWVGGTVVGLGLWGVYTWPALLLPAYGYWAYQLWGWWRPHPLTILRWETFNQPIAQWLLHTTIIWDRTQQSPLAMLWLAHPSLRPVPYIYWRGKKIRYRARVRPGRTLLWEYQLRCGVLADHWNQYRRIYQFGGGQQVQVNRRGHIVADHHMQNHHRR